MAVPEALSGKHRVVARGDVLTRQLDGEAVLLDLASGTYFGLNETGAEMWEIIVGGTSIDALCESILFRHDDADAATIRRDVERLVSELAARGLVDVTPPP